MERLKKKSKKGRSISRQRNLVTLSDSQSMISEQFRTIRANITFSLPEENLKTILITSCSPGEGKSTIAANLAMVFAQEGKSVLLIDADMRKPTVHYTFNLPNTTGLANILVGKSELKDGIQETPILGLHILTSGPIPPNPAELLSTKNTDNLLKKASHYDLIIFDSPPLLTVSDAQVLSNKCDASLLILNSGVTKKQSIKKAKEILIKSKAKILGSVLNNYKISSKHFYEYYNYQGD
ncbi:CpsD/CapB family tyrosine-protein kinase [Ureibacillus acetophenoni]